MGPIQKLLDQLGLLRYFSEVYGNIGDTYGQMSNGLSGATEGNMMLVMLGNLCTSTVYIFFITHSESLFPWWFTGETHCTFESYVYQMLSQLFQFQLDFL